MAFGCTGGRHRSVAISEEVGRRRAQGYRPGVLHRDVEECCTGVDKYGRRRGGRGRAGRGSSPSAVATGWPPRSGRRGATPGPVTAVVTTADDGGSTGRLRAGMRRCRRPATSAGASRPWPSDDRPGRWPTPSTSASPAPTSRATPSATCCWRPGRGDRRLRRGRRGLARLLGLDPAVGRWCRPRPSRSACAPDRRGGGSGGVGVSGEGLAWAASPARALGRVWVAPEPPSRRPPAPKAVVEALAAADQVVLGPGSLYSSVLSAVAVDDVREALAEGCGRGVYVCNLRAEVGETRGYDVAWPTSTPWSATGSSPTWGGPPAGRPDRHACRGAPSSWPTSPAPTAWPTTPTSWRRSCRPWCPERAGGVGPGRPSPVVARSSPARPAWGNGPSGGRSTV